METVLFMGDGNMVAKVVQSFLMKAIKSNNGLLQ
jgi:hypothetical protein